MQSVVRSFEIFELIAEKQPIGVAELAALTGLPKSTLQRTVRALADVGWIQRVGTDRVRWETTARILTIARRGSREVDLREAATTSMQRLRDQTGETVQLLIPDGLERMVCIERVDSTQAVRTFVELGASMPFTATSTGLAVLAHLSNEQVERVLESPLSQLTEQTVTDPNMIRQEIAASRRRGYTVNIGQNRTNVCAIGAAVLSPLGEPVGAICISIPDSRFDESRVPEWAQLVMSTAAEIGERLKRDL